MVKGTGKSGQRNDWARTVRDIAIKAIDSGQFLMFGFILIVVIILIKMPSDVIGEIVKDLFKNILVYATNGFILFVLTLIAVSLYMKAMNKRHKKQISERDEMIQNLNSRLLGAKAETGEKIK
ncbi:hypothetical protein [Acinetobacter ursingii]|uniref:hypothetical protein n=1 Tax=Acinetobacter ursingii TaxID=108980 RepID=UPI0021CD2BBE|nr:hypothetical protein [Acinetobacter ursingii]MCU4496370.1 hypothetical protein [Acinetobacter ursingii]